MFYLSVLMPVFHDNEIEHRHRHSADQERGDFAEHQRDGEPLEDRVGQDDRSADNYRQGGQQHRAEADGPGIDHRLGERFALTEAEFDEVDQDDRIPHHDARAGHKTDH